VNPEHPVHCTSCGRSEYPREDYGPDVGSACEQQALCHNCLFWHSLNPRDPRLALIGGCAYAIMDEDARGPRGYGGLAHRIGFVDGRVVTTTNLWPLLHPAPQDWPDNASFLS
jgi:hypothetical protein